DPSRTLWIELAFARYADERVEARGFGGGGATSASGEREIFASFVGGGRGFCGGDQPVRGEALQDLVEGAGRRIEPATGTLLDVFADRVAVGGALGKRQQGVEGEIRQRHHGPLRRGQAPIRCQVTIVDATIVELTTTCGRPGRIPSHEHNWS